MLQFKPGHAMWVVKLIKEHWPASVLLQVYHSEYKCMCMVAMCSLVMSLCSRDLLGDVINNYKDFYQHY